MTDARNNRPVWTVSELTAAIKAELDEAFPVLQVEGEISNCRPSGAGHYYFTLKDRDAVISAALFRGRAAQAEVKPSDGMQAVATGRIDVYPPRGSYQLIVENLRPAGRGALLIALEERKQRLGREGLFDLERKRPLPSYPRRAAVVTSPTGAAVRDILQVLARRAAAPRVTILPTAVQGAGAAESIADQVRRAAIYGLGDVIIIARGGGSLEDLMPFNDEAVVRAVSECPLPVISGVGHETDLSLTDLAADVRAATPSAAAELVSDRSEDLLLRLHGFARGAVEHLKGRLEGARSVLRRCAGEELGVLAAGRLNEALRRSDEARREICRAAGGRISDYRHRREIAGGLIAESSPEAVMSRGYARVTLEGRGIADSREIKSGDLVTMSFARGSADARIEATESEEK